MSEILILARDYIERMSNPVYGSSVNEDYSIRFAGLLSVNGFEARLNEEIASLDDRNTLTSYGWLWLLEWSKSRRIDLNEELLIGLFEEWSSVFVRTNIVDVGTQSAERIANFRNFSISNFPNGFLSKIMSRSIRVPQRGERLDFQKSPEGEKREYVVSPAMAESALIAFAQVGRPITLDAAGVLLREEWQGREQLVRYFWAMLDLLDEETRALWIERLDPPQRGNQGPRVRGF